MLCSGFVNVVSCQKMISNLSGMGVRKVSKKLSPKKEEREERREGGREGGENKCTPTGPGNRNQTASPMLGKSQ